ncbi:glycosyltransferase family 2 protein [Robbsia sp. Bb-Pol-6]|uniref:Glycosyltransferase family 2 protein n=1 Tax=Robbsia betulipollinis TaxID=2981849 RepID=A0ABT3ZS99_9BURK|nr:glycosyltransferase family 2 protein [Robbsia betulipollinis]MCY0388758.1 glycosyltransferase family 2 protein [Robbsia betulipollinis]
MTELVTIGIVLYRNSAQEIARCLNALKRQTRIDAIKEILIRDQGGGDALEHVGQWCERHAMPVPIRISSGANLGFGGGHNTLFASSDPVSTAYLCLNPDGFMHPRCLEVMLESARKQHWSGIFEAIQEPVMHPKRFDPKTGTTAWCSAACLLIPASLYREIRGFDEDFFLYCEDVDLSWRAKAAGQRCFTCAQAWFFHYAEDRGDRQIEIWRSAHLLAHKWRAHQFKTHAVNVLASLVDIDRDLLEQQTTHIEPHSIPEIFRALPNFRNQLTFAEPMWT